MSWRLRKSDQALYGPVDLPELCRWAAEGRILPDDFVSENEGDWIPATEVADLRLDWLLPRAEGQKLGPFHLLAYGELLQQRMLRGDETIQHRNTGERIPVAQAVSAELLRRLDSANAALAVPPPPPPPPVEEKKPEPEAKPEPKPEPKAEPEPLPVARPEKPDATGIEKEYQDLTRRYERLLAMVREQAERQDQLDKDLAAVRAGADEEAKALAAAKDAAEEEAREARSRLEELTAQHADLIRQFRDLNERYIVLRDERGPAPATTKPKVRLV
ncbi:MAG TPA: GYF domain-containing protein [Kiritimatiellia bacterium]|nr:GYF domain-containing protein [Kiritimatiellia bacterium]